MQIDIVDQAEAMQRLEPEWQRLYSELQATITPFSSYEWYECWWHCYSADGSLFILVGRAADRVVGIAPFMLRQATIHGLPARVLCFIENNQSALNDFIVLPEFRDEFLRKLLDYLESSAACPVWDVLALNRLSVCSENYSELLKILDQNSFSWQESQVIDSRYIVPSGSWDEFMAKRSTRTRKNLRSIHNRMHRAGAVNVEHIQTLDRFEEVWSDMARVAQSSWTEGIGESMVSSVNASFYQDLARAAAENGWLSAWVLKLNGEMLALEFHLRAHGKEYAMIGHYQPDDRKLSPGTYLEMQILKHVFSEEERLEKYDMGNFYSYKRKWTENSEAYMMVSAFNRHLYSRLLAFHEMKTVPALRKVIPQKVWQNKIFRALGIKTAPYEINQR